MRELLNILNHHQSQKIVITSYINAFCKSDPHIHSNSRDRTYMLLWENRHAIEVFVVLQQQDGRMCVYSPDPRQSFTLGSPAGAFVVSRSKKPNSAPTSQKGRSLNGLRCWALHDVQWSINPARKSKSIPVCPGALSFICLCGLTETDMNMKSVQIKSIFPRMKKTVSSDVCSLFLLLHIH